MKNAVVPNSQTSAERGRSLLLQVKPRSETERDRRNRMYQSNERPVASCKMAYNQFRSPTAPPGFRRRYAAKRMLPAKQMRQSKTTSKIRSCRSVRRKFEIAAKGSDLGSETGGMASRLTADTVAARGCSSLMSGWA